MAEKDLAVDPRLDNRTGSDRPPLESDPAVPQQVDGPDLLHQAEHARAVAGKAAKANPGDRKGMFSPGDHSLGDQGQRGGNDAGQADRKLETDPDSPTSASTDAAKAADPGSLVGPGAEQAEEIATEAERRAESARASETASAAPGERRVRSQVKESKSG